MATNVETNQELPVLKNSSLGLEYQPAILKMNNFEQMKEVVTSIAKKYENQVITREMKKSAEQSRSELIAIEKSLDEERKAVKKIYNEPLNAYEKQMKELQGIINDPLNNIRLGLAEVEQGEREEREGILNRYLKEKLEGLDVEINPLDSWLNKGNFTTKGVGTKLAKEIDETIQAAIAEKKRREDNEKIVRTFCETVNVEPDGWLVQLDYNDPMQIIQTIQDKLRADKERAERLEREAKELADLQERNAQALDVSVLAEEKTISQVIEVTGTISQLQALNIWLVDSGITVVPFSSDEPIEETPEDEDLDDSDPFALDDLPF